MKTKFITKFLFNKAQYVTTDSFGREFILEIDYWNNDFVINGEIIDEEVANELRHIALDLLKRKHNKNFAQRKK